MKAAKDQTATHRRDRLGWRAVAFLVLLVRPTRTRLVAAYFTKCRLVTLVNLSNVVDALL